MFNGKHDEAIAVLTNARNHWRTVFGERHAMPATIQGYIAAARAMRGESRRALHEFRDAMPIVLAAAAAGDDEDTTRSAPDLRLTFLVGVYMNLLAGVRGTPLEREAGIDATAEAFRLAEVLRGRSVQRALDASAARAMAATPALAELVRREQDAGKQERALAPPVVRLRVRLLIVRRPEHLTQARKVSIERIDVPPLLVENQLSRVISSAVEGVVDAALILGPGSGRHILRNGGTLVLTSSLDRHIEQEGNHLVLTLTSSTSPRVRSAGASPGRGGARASPAAMPRGPTASRCSSGSTAVRAPRGGDTGAASIALPEGRCHAPGARRRWRSGSGRLHPRRTRKGSPADAPGPQRGAVDDAVHAATIGAEYREGQPVTAIVVDEARSERAGRTSRSADMLAQERNLAMPLSPEDRKLVARRLKALDAQPAFQKLVEEARAERLQRRQAELQGPSSPPR